MSVEPATDIGATDAGATRQAIWAKLREVARPDSRFHWDFSAFIPDYDGSERSTDRVFALEALRNPNEHRLFVTPDNSTELLRYRLLVAGHRFAMTTYGIVRGFLELDPAKIPADQLRYAATLDGADCYGQPVSMAELRTGEPFGLLMTGSAAVSSNGVRFGKGHGYFDLEWAMLSELGLTGPDTVIVALVHDCQVVEAPLEAKPHDVVVDLIATPTRLVKVQRDVRPPGVLRWADLESGELSELGVIAEVRSLLPDSPNSP